LCEIKHAHCERQLKDKLSTAINDNVHVTHSANTLLLNVPT